MPSVSEAQHRAMEAAAHGHSTLGIPESVGKEFANADKRSDADAPDVTTELDTAKAIRDGALKSPQQFENCWLISVRVTGTGVSYRAGLQEFVIRPEEYFNGPGFVERCNGLPLVLGHPEKGLLNDEEYARRNLGTVILPYQQGDEVWGIAKLYSEEIVDELAKGDLSTSPGVRFSDPEQLTSVDIGGDSLLLEGKASHIDHLAIVPAGVWDKGGDPSGIRIDSLDGHAATDAETQPKDVAASQGARPPELKDTAMTEKSEEDRARNDADPMRALMDKLDALCSRVDAFEAKDKKDGDEKKPEDKADAELDEKEHDKEGEAEKKAVEEHEKEEKADKKDAADAVLSARIREMEAQLAALARPRSHDDLNALAAAQSRADSVAQLFGEHADAPFANESPLSYRRRILGKFQKHSSRFADVRVDRLDGAVLDEIERGIYADAQAAASSPSVMAPGVLIPQVSTDEAGRKITRFHGDIKTAFAPFMTNGQTLRLNTNRSAN